MKKYGPAFVAIAAFFLLFLTKEHMTRDPEEKENPRPPKKEKVLDENPRPRELTKRKPSEK